MPKIKDWRLKEVAYGKKKAAMWRKGAMNWREPSHRKFAEKEMRYYDDYAIKQSRAYTTARRKRRSAAKSRLAAQRALKGK